MRHFFGFHYTLLPRFGRGVVTGLRDIVEKKILTQLIIKGALGCTTPTEHRQNGGICSYPGRRRGGGVLEECEAAFLRFPPHVVDKVRQGGRYESEGWCCKKDLNTTNY